MATAAERILKAAANEAAPAKDDVLAVAAETPYFTLGASLLMKHAAATLTDDERRRLMAQLALNSPDTGSLFSLCDRDGNDFANFYPPTADSTPTTDSAIDTFLSTYGNIDPKEAALLERLIFNPVADYSQVLASEAQQQADNKPAEKHADEQDKLLDAFLGKYAAPAEAEEAKEQPAPKASPKSARPKPDADAPLSESLAKIYVRRGRYDKAFEIIRSLSLNYPEKSIYFADQMRFLQKLIINQRRKANN